MPEVNSRLTTSRSSRSYSGTPSEKVSIRHREFNCLGAFGNVKVGWLRSQPKDKYAIKTMKKAEIIASKHVDHIENEKKILELIVHPFAVSKAFSG